MRKCISCKKDYNEFMLSNYNLGLCQECFNLLEHEKIGRDEFVDRVTHKIICPKCKKAYHKVIVDQKCETPDCNVWFFWNDLDCVVYARWIDL